MADEALILMLNAIRLQLFAAQMKEVSPELEDCLKQSARLADMAMQSVGLKGLACLQCHGTGVQP